MAKIREGGDRVSLFECRVNVVLTQGWDGEACFLGVERATSLHLTVGAWDIRLLGLLRGYKVTSGQTPLRLQDFPEAIALIKEVTP